MFIITRRLGNHSLWERNDFLEKGKTGLLLLYNKLVLDDLEVLVD